MTLVRERHPSWIRRWHPHDRISFRVVERDTKDLIEAFRVDWPCELSRGGKNCDRGQPRTSLACRVSSKAVGYGAGEGIRDHLCSMRLPEKNERRPIGKRCIGVINDHRVPLCQSHRNDVLLATFGMGIATHTVFADMFVRCREPLIVERRLA